MKLALLGNPECPTAFGRINDAWTGCLSRLGVEVVREWDDSVDFVVHHDFSEDFSHLKLPFSCPYAVVRPWDFGPYPRLWVDKINQARANLWVHSQHTLQSAVGAGIDPELVSILPLGMDAELFRPEGERWSPEPSSFQFLFVGNANRRKGFDLALKAFAKAFTAEDDVCLVVKDSTGDVFYQGLSLAEQVASLSEEPSAPTVVYLDQNIPAARLAALFRGADAGLFPYRGEGFALPILECLACGTPVVAPRFGPVLDYCREADNYLTETRVMAFPYGRELQYNTLGFRIEVEELRFCETRVEALVSVLRALYESDPKTRGRVGEVAAREVATWTWERSVTRMLQLIRQQVGKMS